MLPICLTTELFKDLSYDEHVVLFAQEMYVLDHLPVEPSEYVECAVDFYNNVCVGERRQQAIAKVKTPDPYSYRKTA